MAFQNPRPEMTGEDPNAQYVAASCFEFLLMELVPMAYRLAAEQAERELVLLGKKESPEIEDTYTGGQTPTELEAARQSRRIHDAEMGAGFGIGGIGGAVKGMEEEETRERVWQKLDAMGYRVGQGLVEKFSRDKPRFTETLDGIKFLCKDLWQIVFRKQIDNLKTNHRGIYVLTDVKFQPLAKISHERGREGILQQTQPFLYFPAGIIRGALASMGIKAQVQAECQELPGATFQIRTIGAKS